MEKRDYSTHVMLVAWINIVFGAMFAFIGVFAFVFLTGIGVAAQDAEAVSVLGFIGTAAAIFFITLSLPGILAGIGLLQRKAWGRILGIVVAILDLFNVPVGTALGIYTLWVLTANEATAYFGGSPAATPTAPASQPGAVARAGSAPGGEREGSP